MTLATHRIKENLGGVVHLLTIDASSISERPTDVLRFVNSQGADGLGVLYQGNRFNPYPYNIKTVRRSSKANKSGAKIEVGDFDLKIARFIDYIGGDLSGARVYEMRVYGVHLDNGTEANVQAYVKRMDHTINNLEDSGKKQGEITLHTVDPLSKLIEVPSITFSAGIPNSTEYVHNVFPAVNRALS